jgi:hypothetical protein
LASGLAITVAMLAVGLAPPARLHEVKPKHGKPRCRRVHRHHEHQKHHRNRHPQHHGARQRIG